MTNNQSGTALKLGFNAHIWKDSEPKLTQTPNQTLELWAYINAIEPSANLVSKTGEGTDYQLSLSHHDGTFELQLQIGSGVFRAELPNPYARWMHLAFIIEQQAQHSAVKLLVDGQVVAEGPIAELWSDAVGKLNIGGGLDGYVTEIRRWQGAIEPSVVKARADISLNGVEPGLLSWLPLGEDSQLKDIVDGGVCQGVLYQWQAFESPVVQQTTDTLYLDRHDEWITCHWSEGFPQQRWTLEFWYRSYHATGESVLAEYAGDDGSLGLRLNNPHNLTLNIGGIEAVTGLNLVNGRWQHIAVSWNQLSGAVNLYHNGIKFAETIKMPRQLIMPPAGELRLGAGFDDSHGHPGCYLAEARLWSTVRTSDEIRNNCLNRLEGDEYPLAQYWPLSQPSGNELQSPVDGAPAGEVIGGRWVVEALTIAPSPAAQLRQLRQMAWQYEQMPQPQTGDGAGDASGVPVSDLGLAFEAKAFIGQLASQLADVDAPGYRLNAVDIDARVLLSADGSKIIVPYPDRLRALDPGHYSALKFSFAPDYTDASQPRLMPDVIGNTQSYAVERLVQQQLGYRIVHQWTQDPTQAGVVIAQQPQAQSQVDDNKPVTLIVGSHSDNTISE